MDLKTNFPQNRRVSIGGCACEGGFNEDLAASGNGKSINNIFPSAGYRRHSTQSSLTFLSFCFHPISIDVRTQISISTSIISFRKTTKKIENLITHQTREKEIQTVNFFHVFRGPFTKFNARDV